MAHELQYGQGMTQQILHTLNGLNQADICELSERVRQTWPVTSYGVRILVDNGMVEVLPLTHPTYRITDLGRRALGG